MKVYVVGSSALHFWRHCPNPKSYLNNVVFNPLEDSPMTRKDLIALEPELNGFGKPPIRLMTNSKDRRILRSRFHYTVRSQPLSEMAFHRISDSVCVASPEHCILQAASSLSFARLAELCMELCGNYILAPETQEGFANREISLTTEESIAYFLQSVEGEIGFSKLSQMLRYVRNGSRSPMESREYLLLCLPKRHGGYGIPLPELNARIPLTNKEQAIAERRYFECDLFWKDRGVAIEYDGHGFHASYEDRSRDAIKKNILMDRGYAVFTVTGKQIKDARAFDKHAHEVASSIGFRLRQFPENWASRRDDLRRELFRSLALH